MKKNLLSEILMLICVETFAPQIKLLISYQSF